MDEKIRAELEGKLWTGLVGLYGHQCYAQRELIQERLEKMLAATLYAGNEGDNPLVKLNQAFDAVSKPN